MRQRLMLRSAEGRAYSLSGLHEVVELDVFDIAIVAPDTQHIVAPDVQGPEPAGELDDAEPPAVGIEHAPSRRVARCLVFLDPKIVGCVAQQSPPVRGQLSRKLCGGPPAFRPGS